MTGPLAIVAYLTIFALAITGNVAIVTYLAILALAGLGTYRLYKDLSEWMK